MDPEECYRIRITYVPATTELKSLAIFLGWKANDLERFVDSSNNERDFVVVYTGQHRTENFLKRRIQQWMKGSRFISGSRYRLEFQLEKYVHHNNCEHPVISDDITASFSSTSQLEEPIDDSANDLDDDGSTNAWLKRDLTEPVDLKQIAPEWKWINEKLSSPLDRKKQVYRLKHRSFEGHHAVIFIYSEDRRNSAADDLTMFKHMDG